MTSEPLDKHKSIVPGVLCLMYQLTFCDRRSARAGSRGSATSVPCRSGLPDLRRRWPRSGISVWSLRSGGYPRVSYWREEVAMCSGDRLVAGFIAGTDAWPGLPEELDEHLTTTANGQWVVWAHKLARQKGDLFVPLTGGPGYPADARAECRFQASEALTMPPIRGARAASTPCRAGGSRGCPPPLHGADRGAVRTGAGLRVGRRRSAVGGGAADRGSHRPASPVRSDSRTPGQAPPSR
jgi:hypothetical protein